jgi:ribose transport system permease protein
MARLSLSLRWARRNQGPLFAALLFAVLFVAFVILHPRGLSVLVTTPAANQGLALAFAAMAQTLPVLTGGLDLSVGSVLALTDCAASHLVSGSTAEIVAGIIVTLLAGAACGFINGLVVVVGRIQPIIATLATGAIFTGIAYLLRPIPGGTIDEDLGDLLTNETFGVIPTALLLLIGVVLVVWVPYRNSTIGRGGYAAGSSEQAAFLSGVRVGRARLAAYTLAGLLSGCGGLFLALQTLSGDAQIGADYTLKSIAAVVIGGTSLAGGMGGVIGSIFGAYVLRTITALLLFTGISPLAQPLFEGAVLLAAIGLGSLRILANRNRLELLSAQETARSDPGRPLLRGVDNSVLVALLGIVVILLLGSLYLPEFLSPDYLVLQLRIAAFLGIVAAGEMLVILLGHIDLSIPWTMTAAAMTATTLVGMGDPWAAVAIPAGLAVGAVVGLLNGFGVAYLRLPSMILTLGTNAVLLGLAVIYTGGFAPQTKASALMRTFGKDSSIVGVPNILWVWLAGSLLLILLLRATPFGRKVYAIGNRERAAYLSGVRTARVVLTCFVISGVASALGGILLAGRLDQSYQGMGDEYLLPAVAAVVLGGTYILGGRGSYVGTVAGVLVISLLSSMLSVMQMPEASRRIIYGIVIIAMLLLNARGTRRA